ncbi:MAG: hypothetical protein HY828_11915 [Actinobacteria bacterium]|nr:hypothetical protein [Actinomycetota bacterium]
MRSRLLLAAALAFVVPVVAVSAPPAHAAPAGCRANANGVTEFCDHFDPTGRNRGAIGLVGDSVLLGSSPGMSTPSLPALLASSGWGPVRMSTALGMRTYASAPNLRDASLFHWFARWKSEGFTPRAIAVNVGGNNLSTCSWPNIAPCKAAIDQVLNEIAAQYPAATVWWAKTNYRMYPSNQFSPGMLGWNAALDQAAAERSNLLLWDWPAALLNANPPIITDLGAVHPVSGTEYVKRSRLIATDLDTRMPANFAGPRITPPALPGTSMAFTPTEASTVYDTRTSGAMTAGEHRTIALGAAAPAATGVALTVTAREASAGGYLRFYACGTPEPATSNINFQPGVVRTAQVLVALDATQQLCVYSNVAVHFDLALQGTFGPTGLGLTAITPTRTLDTRISGRANDLVVAVPASQAVAASIVAVGPSAGGTVTVYQCGTAIPSAFTFSFEPDEVIAGSIFVATSASNTICVHVNANDTRGVDIVVDITGTFSNDPAGLRFSPVTGTRLLDTRSGEGGWYGRQAPGQSINIVGAPGGVAAVSGTLTMVQPPSNSHLRAWQCGTALPPTSAVNARGGLAAANNVTTAIAGDLTLCVWASQNTSTLFDVMGYWVHPG